MIFHLPQILLFVLVIFLGSVTVQAKPIFKDAEVKTGNCKPEAIKAGTCKPCRRMEDWGCAKY